MKWHVFEVMHRGAFCAQPDNTLSELVNELQSRKISAAPVVDREEKLVGVVSLRDVALARPDQLVKEVMSTPAITVDQAATMPTVLKMFEKHKVHRLVVTHQDRVLGVLSLVDLLGPLAEAYVYPNFS
ncbi:MAG: CBS domain-containing protein [Candidatus Eremiobacteraeota bacterium]|nr:CBS domain-containing protein [Candidatus Eremiobacteraeota bacterium]